MSFEETPYPFLKLNVAYQPLMPGAWGGLGVTSIPRHLSSFDNKSSALGVAPTQIKTLNYLPKHLILPSTHHLRHALIDRARSSLLASQKCLLPHRTKLPYKLQCITCYCMSKIYLYIMYLLYLHQNSKNDLRKLDFEAAASNHVALFGWRNGG